jgi:endonuclease YncB( thermonuclease family)
LVKILIGTIIVLKKGREMKKIIMIFLLSFTILSAQTLTGNVSYVSDGDTIHIVTNNQKYKIRFYGIDTPEKTQEYGLEAKSFVHKRIANKNVKVEVMDTDRYGRKVGKVYYNGKYLNKEIVKNGYAWWYKNYAKNDKDLENAEKYARANKLGLWKSPNPIAPWDYRRGKKNKTISNNSSSKNLDSVVYVTKSGKKYHRKGCTYLRSVGGSYPLKEAEALGYEACRRY